MRKVTISFFLLFLFLGPHIPLSAKENKKQSIIKVGVYDNSPKVFINKNGKPDGIFIDVIKSIARKENIQIEYVSGEWNQLVTMLGSGEINVLPDVAYSNERDSIFSLSTLPVLGSWLEVFTTRATKINSVLDLQNKRIGVLKGSIQDGYLKNVVNKDFNLTNEIFLYNDYSSSVLSLKNKEIDAVVVDRFFYFSEMCDEEIVPTGIIFRPTELYFAFSKGNDPDLVMLFDKNLSLQKNNSKSDYYKSLKRWLDKDYKAGTPQYIFWLIIIIGSVLFIVSAFAFLLRYKVNAKTKMLRMRNLELILVKEKVEESDRLKTAFLQNMSHEIRTPMNGIIGFLGLLREPDLDEVSKNRYIDLVNKSGQRLLNTINNIIEISKIESNQISIRYAKVNLREIMDFHLNFFKLQADEKGLELRISEQVSDDKAIVETDKYILDYILTNLINNAIKFTHIGSVEFGNYLEDDSIVFYIKDTGIGIPSYRLEAIFERFIQADLSITRAHEGSGLGLSIVKAYAEKLNGKNWVESEVNKGSTFFFSIPYNPVQKKVEKVVEKAEPYTLSGKILTILVAEDDDISFLYIKKILDNQSINLLRATNGNEVIDLFKANPDISLILMDIKMSELSGLDVTRQIRKFNKTVPIIAQTAYAYASDKEKAMEAGCDDYIVKPISKNKLIQLIQKYTQPMN